MSESVDKRLYRSLGVSEGADAPLYVELRFSMGRLRNGKELVVARPNVIALYLSIADKSIAAATEIYGDISPSLHDEGDHCGFNSQDADSRVADFIEQIFVATVFAYAAAEALANSIIPHTYKSIRKRQGKEFPVDKDWIERHEKLSTKYTEIIPEEFQCDSPTQQPFWNDFLKLENLRNEIIHYKSDVPSLDKQVPKVLQDLILHMFKSDVIESSRKLIVFVVRHLPDQFGVPKEFTDGAFMIDSWDDLSR